MNKFIKYLQDVLWDQVGPGNINTVISFMAFKRNVFV